jgi:hypothetical protein
MLIDKTKEELQEVKVFLAKYPDADIRVDISSRLAVDYSQEYREVTPNNRNGTEYHTYLRLRLFMSPEGELGDMFTDCRDIHDGWMMVENSIVSYLQTETCFR